MFRSTATVWQTTPEQHRKNCPCGVAETVRLANVQGHAPTCTGRPTGATAVCVFFMISREQWLSPLSINTLRQANNVKVAATNADVDAVE